MLYAPAKARPCTLRRVLFCTVFWALLCALLATLTGCAAKNTYEVTVNTLAAQDYAPGAPPGSYYLFPEDEHIARDDLLFVEVVNRVKPVMAARGMPITDNVREADYVAFVSYGTGNLPPPGTRSRVWPAPSLGFGFGSGFGWGTFAGLGLSYPLYPATTTDTPQYIQHIKLTAFAVDKAKKELGRQIWSAEAISSGESDDFRTALPAMLMPTGPYMGKDSAGHKKFVVTLREGKEPEVTEKK